MPKPDKFLLKIVSDGDVSKKLPKTEIATVIIKSLRLLIAIFGYTKVNIYVTGLGYIIHTLLMVMSQNWLRYWSMMMEYLSLGREPTSLNQETVTSMFFFAKHWNEADWPKAIVLTAGVTTIPGAEITSAACPLNGWREVGVSEVGSPGSPFCPFIPGGPGSPGYPGGPWGPRGPTFPGGPCTQIWLLPVQIFFVTE